MLYGLEYLPTEASRKWLRCSLSMRDSDALRREAQKLAAHEGWFAFKIINL